MRNCFKKFPRRKNQHRSSTKVIKKLNKENKDLQNKANESTQKSMHKLPQRRTLRLVMAWKIGLKQVKADADRLRGVVNISKTNLGDFKETFNETT